MAAIMTYDEICDQLDKQLKVAEEQESQNITGQAPESIPGSEHDKPAPEAAQNSDENVKDETAGGSETRTVSGAEPGSDNKPLEPQLLEANEPALTPEKKPLESADANAKEASANNIVAFVLEKTQKKAAALATKKAEECCDKKDDEKKDDEKKEEKKEDGEKSASTTPDRLELDTGILAKIAAHMLADEEGAQMVEYVLSKKAGAEFAQNTMNALRKEAEFYDAQREEFIKGAQAAEDQIQEAAGAQDVDALIDDAAAEAGAEGGAPEEGADLLGAGDDAGEGVEDDAPFTPEEVNAELEQLVEEGVITPEQVQEFLEEADADPMNGMSEEDIAEGIDALIQDGDLSPEAADALTARLEGEDAGDAGDAGEPPAAPEPAPAGEGAAPEPAADVTPEPKEAAAKPLKKQASARAMKLAAALMKARK